MPKVTEAHVEARKMQILSAACVCFARKGLHGTTMQDLCKAAGLSTGAVYGYFSGKEAVIKAIVELSDRSTGQIFAKLKGMKARDALEEFNRLAFDYSECAPEGTPGDFDMNRIKVGLWAEGVRNEEFLNGFRENYRNLTGHLASILRQGQRDGEIRKELDPHATAVVLLSIIEGYVLQKAVDPEGVDRSAYENTIRRMFAECLFVKRSRKETRRKRS